MSSRKKRRTRRGRSGQSEPRTRPRRKGVLSTPSLIFIGLIVLMVVAAAVAATLRDGADCPVGEVWSDAHGHCH